MFDTARAVKAAGATALRGGAFKARTSPYSFQGMKEDGLKILAAARDETGLAFVTEVVSANDVPLVARYADVLQIGARNMQNFRLLEAVGAVRAPVLLKRGPSATMEELLLAAEYILDAGNPHVALCERGIRTFEDHTRYTLSLSAIPWLHQRTHLPVIADPSHGTGHASLVASMAAASVAAGADGLLVEVHPRPAAALKRRAAVARLRAVRPFDGPLRPRCRGRRKAAGPHRMPCRAGRAARSGRAQGRVTAGESPALEPAMQCAVGEQCGNCGRDESSDGGKNGEKENDIFFSPIFFSTPRFAISPFRAFAIPFGRRASRAELRV